MAVELPSAVFESSEVIREVAQNPTVLGLSLETALAVATGGGVVAAAIGGVKLASLLFRRKKSEVVNLDAPFPRRLDEARQLREQAYELEGRCPEFDCAVGRIAEEEVDLWFQRADPADKEVLGRFWLGVRNRVDRMLPASVKEYLPKMD